MKQTSLETRNNAGLLTEPIDLCGRCLPLFVEAFPFYQITKGETGKDKCGSCGKRKEVTTCLYRRKECSREAA